MIKNKNEIIRLQNVLEKDRVKSNENFRELIIDDVTKILSDYFDYKEKPELEINKEDGKFIVKIILTATSIRSFGFLPKN
ncbi:MAG: hypothetical protein IJX16_06490 [Clostridia bacterium]|nr:hypothetical protein [Clostridia bacterium]